jgi:hypothetical protein
VAQAILPVDVQANPVGWEMCLCGLVCANGLLENCAVKKHTGMIACATDLFELFDEHDFRAGLVVLRVEQITAVGGDAQS